jgi:RNA polymerase sigma factor (sigma-70 family)
VSAAALDSAAKRRNPRRALQSRDRGVFTASRPRHYAFLLNLLRRLGRSREDAEDLIQEAMLRHLLYSRSAEVINDEAFLRRAVHNLSIDQYRRHRPDLHRQVPFDSINLDAEYISTDPTPEQIVETHQRLDIVSALLNAASKRTHEVYIAFRVGYSYAEIANNMNISNATVRRHISRASRIVTEHQAKERHIGYLQE